MRRLQQPLEAGPAVTLTAAVGAPDARKVTGTMKFFDAGVEIGEAAVQGGKATLTTTLATGGITRSARATAAIRSIHRAVPRRVVSATSCC